MRTRILVPMLLALALTSCKVGGWRTHERTSAFGAQVSLITVSGDQFEGELLLADRESVLLSVGPELVRAAWQDLRDFQVKRYPVDRIRAGDTLSDELLRRIQLVSRYPYGLTDAQLAQFIGDRGQDEIREVR